MHRKQSISQFLQRENYLNNLREEEDPQDKNLVVLKNMRRKSIIDPAMLKIDTAVDLTANL